MSITAEELLQRYAAGERDFAGVSLRKIVLVNANLRGINLPNADLRFANLIAVKLTDANLSQVNFTGADLTGARLDRSNLQGVSFECDAVGAIFDQADLRRAGMYRARLNGARFDKANLEGAILGCTDLLGTSFRNANLRSVDLEEAVGAADFTDANLLGASAYDFEFRLGRSIFCRTVMQDGSIRNDGCLGIADNI
ncbi:pentapeptide repeat-containing protein [Nostoc sp.]|uniref:pentapeptide repeat-containing protein n=1 Tax=Nostoc sp. TaxID=1180 RepID=UPI002FF5E601